VAGSEHQAPYSCLFVYNGYAVYKRRRGTEAGNNAAPRETPAGKMVQWYVSNGSRVVPVHCRFDSSLTKLRRSGVGDPASAGRFAASFTEAVTQE